MYLFELYQKAIKKKSATLTPFKPASEWPIEWTTVTYKVYERFPLLKLPISMPDEEGKTLFTAMYSRQSGRNFSSIMTTKMMSDMLYYSVGEQKMGKERKVAYMTDITKRMCPSGGGRYPLEAYLLLLKPIGEFLPGVYHYDVLAHGLRQLRSESVMSEQLSAATMQSWLKSAAGALVLTAIPARGTPKYRELTYKFILLEAGAILQNAALIAAEHGFAASQVGLFAEDVVESLLDIDGQQETYIQALFFG